MYADRVLAEVLSGSTEHAGALLGPLGIRFVVAGVGGLPEAAKRSLDAQVDMDLKPAGGLIIYKNERALPPAALTFQPEYVQASRGSSLLAIESLPPFEGDSLRAVPGGFGGSSAAGRGAGVALIGDQFAPGWQVLFLPVFAFIAFTASIGIGVWITALNVKYRDFRYVIPFMVQMGLYVSPVGFSSNVIPEGWRLLYSPNPMVGVIDGFRWCLLGGESQLYLPAFWLSLGVAIFFLWLGARRFRRKPLE